jgi:flagellar biosynthesis protein FlhG
MKFISVTSGKGGVGKTTVICNLALSLAHQGYKILILDGDIGMSNVDIFFGVRAQKNIKDLLEGVSIKNCITPLVKSVDLLSGGSGLHECMNLSIFERREVINQVQSIHLNYDFVLIDTAPGLHDYVLHLNSIADQCVFLITQDPSSFADAYALLKTLHQKYKMKDFHIICNQVHEVSGSQLFTKFSDVCEKFLDVHLNYLGTISHDPVLKKMQQMQRLILRQGIVSEAKKQIEDLSVKLIDRMKAKDLQMHPHGLGRIFSPVTGHA